MEDDTTPFPASWDDEPPWLINRDNEFDIDLGNWWDDDNDYWKINEDIIPKPRGIWKWFRKLLKSDSVRLYVWPYYLFFFMWGIYGTFAAIPNTVIEPVMGHMVYDIWVWMCIGGPLLGMIGQVIPGDDRSKLRYFGVSVELAGNMSVAFILAALEYSVITGTPWGRGSVMPFIICPYIIGCSFLALRNVLQLTDAEWYDPEEAEEST